MLLLSPTKPFGFAGGPEVTWTAELLLIRRVDDLYEVGGLQGRAADQAAVHVRLGEQLGGVLCIHGAAVL